MKKKVRCRFLEETTTQAGSKKCDDGLLRIYGTHISHAHHFNLKAHATSICLNFQAMQQPVVLLVIKEDPTFALFSR